jgi:hypothetical protein
MGQAVRARPVKAMIAGSKPVRALPEQRFRALCSSLGARRGEEVVRRRPDYATEIVPTGE